MCGLICDIKSLDRLRALIGSMSDDRYVQIESEGMRWSRDLGGMRTKACKPALFS